MGTSDIPAPRIGPSRSSVIRALQPGESIVVRGRRSVVSPTSYRVLGKGCYRVEQVSATHCRVWRI